MEVARSPILAGLEVIEINPNEVIMGGSATQFFFFYQK
jgi:hypothetical protein